MPVSGLVVTLSDDKDKQLEAIRLLTADRRITIGEQQKNRLPIVVETDDVRQGSRLVRQGLVEITGVVFVDVVTVNFEDVTLDKKSQKEQ